MSTGQYTEMIAREEPTSSSGSWHSGQTGRMDYARKITCGMRASPTAWRVGRAIAKLRKVARRRGLGW